MKLDFSKNAPYKIINKPAKFRVEVNHWHGWGSWGSVLPQCRIINVITKRTLGYCTIKQGAVAEFRKCKSRYAKY